MAYTRIHSIKRTVDKSLDYIKNEKKTTFIGGKGSKDDLQRAMQYIANAKKTTSTVSKEYRFVEGWQCDPQFATYQFEETKKKYLEAHGGRERNTTGTPTIAFHFIQSFDPSVTDPVLVHQIGMELAEKIGDGGYQCVVASHIEGSHVLHNHIICNAYPIDPYGHKYHRSVAEYQKIQQLSDEIGLKYGIEPIISNDEKENASIGIGELSAKQKGQSWKQKVKDDIEKMSDIFDNWDDFKNALITNGYKIEEHDGYVKYESPYSKRSVRDRTLGESYTRDYLKAQWNPEEKKEYEKRRAEKKTAAEKNKQSDYKQYDAVERERWREAEKLAAKQGSSTRMRPEDKAYKVPRFDENGNRRSNVTMLFLVAVKIIQVDKNLFEDATGLQKFPYSPIYAPRDWKMQRMMEGATESSKLGIKEVTDIEQKMQDLGNKLTVVSTNIRKKKAYLNRIDNLHISDGVMTIKAEHNLKPAPESANLVAKVVWNDKDNAAGKRPDSIKIDIQQDGKSIHSEPQPITKDKEWTMTVLGVKKDAAYTAKVSRVDGYDATVKDATVEDGQTTIEIVYTMKEEIAPTPAPAEAPKPTDKPSEPEQTKVESKTETKTEEKTPVPADASSTAPKVVIKTDVKPTGVSFLASLFGK